ncbi:hypothetical protein WMW72_24415 [Paenibacillus filicis]|uniref:Uncharacterized protein n=1 Tax=Paenibacillus filicis TaxID=669464 RepID=A0ABU9DQS1_9BACL
MNLIQLSPQLHQTVKQMKETGLNSKDLASASQTSVATLSEVESYAVMKTFNLPEKAKRTLEPRSEW